MALPRLIDIWRAPRKTLRDLSEQRARTGATAAATLGAIWGLFSLALYLGGHAPSVTLVPIAAERYYLAQAVFAVPLWLVLWRVASTVAHRCAVRLGGVPDQGKAVAAIMGHALAAPMIALFLLPDVLVYATLGFEALGRAMRWYAPLGPLVAWAMASYGLKVSHDLSTGRAIVAAFAGLLAQAVVGAPLLR